MTVLVRVVAAIHTHTHAHTHTHTHTRGPPHTRTGERFACFLISSLTGPVVGAEMLPIDMDPSFEPLATSRGEAQCFATSHAPHLVLIK